MTNFTIKIGNEGKIITEKFELTWGTGDEGEIILETLEVKKEYRGKGLATSVLSEFINAHKGKKIELFAYPLDNVTDLKPTVKFYENAGFEIKYEDSQGVLMFLNPL